MSFSENKCDNCPVCLESLMIDDCSIICKHTFHVSCLDEWFKKHNTCPMCRCVIKQIRSSCARKLDFNAAREDDMPDLVEHFDLRMQYMPYVVVYTPPIRNVFPVEEDMPPLEDTADIDE